MSFQALFKLIKCGQSELWTQEH